ncbi:MAG: tetratricopeptide repeat protein [Planctomycetes bacterium]|nr:tetratricopeptide repeat protein [Planctomycetota bacterium]
MAQSPSSPSSSDPRRVLETLVFQCLERIEQGDAIALDELCARHPEHADALRRSIEALAVFESDPGLEPRRTLGGYSLVRRIGGGGMGVVWLADDKALGRQVALKLIRPEQLWFEGNRERFRREVTTIARLDHPGIVPVYGVGEDDGVPWFAMRWIDGPSLAVVLSRLAGRDPSALRATDLASDPRLANLDADVERVFGRSWIESCLRLVERAARALAHAHERGVVHRDVKPANIVIDRDGQPVLVDFGVATAGGNARITRTGVQPGSVPYMSPEQIRGETLDARSDVYSLGVTLYELLTLESPFLGATHETTRELVLRGEPRRLRATNTAIPSDAETVCLCAMSAEKVRRYASARDFAEDLANVLASRPIRARRMGPLARAQRFARRRPAAAVAIALAFLLFGVAPGVGWLTVRAEMTRTQEAKVAAERTITVLSGIFDSSNPFETDRSDMTARDALDAGFARIETELAEEPAVRAELAGVVGRAYYALGMNDRAARLLEDALAARRASSTPDARALCDALRALAAVRAASGRAEEACALSRERVAILGASDRTDPCALAVALADQSDHERTAGRLDDARRIAQRAEELASDASPIDHAALAQCAAALGASCSDLHDHEAAIAALQRAADHLAAAGPIRALDHAYALNNLGRVLELAGRLADAQTAFESSRAILEARLAPDHPSLGTSCMNLGTLRAKQGDAPSAVDWFRRGLEILHAAHGDRHPSVAIARMNLGNALAQSGDLANASVELEAAATTMREVAPQGHVEIAITLNNLAGIRIALGRLDEAETAARDAASIVRTGLGAHPIAVDSLMMLASIRHARSDLPGAEEAMRDAVAMAKATLGDAHLDVHRAQKNHAVVLTDLGRFDDAIAVLDDALTTHRRMPETDAHLVDQMRVQRASCLEGRGDRDGAWGELEGMLDAFLARDPSDETAAAGVNLALRVAEGRAPAERLAALRDWSKRRN